MIRSQSFGESVSLNANFTGASQLHFLPQVGQDDQRRLTLSSGKLPGGYAWMKQFLLRAGLVKKKRMLWHISKLLLLSSSCWKHSGGFSLIFQGPCMRATFMKCGSLHGWFPWSFLFSAPSTLNLQQYVVYSSGFLAPALVSLDFSAHEFLLQQVVILCICSSVSPNLGTAVCPVTPLFSGSEESC